MKLFGIEFSLGGECDTNDKLERYHELQAYGDDIDDDLDTERMELFHELLTAEVIQYDEPKGFWGKLFG